MYARLMTERFGATEASARLRFHTQTGGVTLTAQQPLNNVVRVAVQTLAAALGGTQSLHTNGYDEALALPSAEAATLALRTQQIVAYESGVAQTVDPLAGSYYLERLTTELEERATALLDRVETMGGAARAVEQGFLQDEIARSAYEQQLAVESGAVTIVGVNRFTDDAEPLAIPAPDYSALERAQVAKLVDARARRDRIAVERALETLGTAAAPMADGHSAPLMPLIIDAVRARATVGEIADTLSARWGRYRPV
jgi:methylmalonyl-CoA mutase, N-terminal domain